MNDFGEVKLTTLERLELIAEHLGEELKIFPNGQIQIRGVNYWTTSNKWFDPKTKTKGEYLTSFRTFLEEGVPSKVALATPAFQSYFSAGDESELLCSECESKLDEDWKFCPMCGEKFIKPEDVPPWEI